MAHTFSLVAEAVLFAAVRALPCDPVAGHAPYVFIHTHLTDLKTAPTGPAERGNLPAAMAGFVPGSAPFPAILFFHGYVGHNPVIPFS